MQVKWLGPGLISNPALPLLLPGTRTASAMPSLESSNANAYEEERARRIAENKRVLEVGVQAARAGPNQASLPSAPHPQLGCAGQPSMCFLTYAHEPATQE